MKNIKRKRAILVTLPAIFARIIMLGRLTIKADNSWLGHKRLKAMADAMEVLYKNNIMFTPDGKFKNKHNISI